MNPTTGTTRRRRLEQQRHAIAISVTIITLIATVSGWTPNPATAWTIAIIAIAIGLPHGALDIVIGPRLTRPALFFGMYLAAAISIVLIWSAAPALGLVVFFTSSWFHFARGDAAHHRELNRAGSLLGMSTAGCAIGLPLALHPGIVTPVLSDLMLGTASITSGQVALFGVIIAAPSLAAGLAATRAALQNRRYSAVIEIAAIALLAATVHPLVSFALYFALWHAPRHLITLDIDRRALSRAVWTTAATLLAGALIWFLIEPTATAATRVVFIGLAALTGPHLVLTELLRARTTQRIDPSPGRVVHRPVEQRVSQSTTCSRSRSSVGSRVPRQDRGLGWPRSTRPRR